MSAFIHGSITPLILSHLVGCIQLTHSGILKLECYIDHAHAWIHKIKPECDLGLRQLVNPSGAIESPILTHSPVRFLRELQRDGSDIFLGDVGLFRCSRILLENPKHDDATNLTLSGGHNDIVWTIGGMQCFVVMDYSYSLRVKDFLVPSHHGKGIMTDAVDTLINEIGKPFLGVRHIITMAYVENEGSKKVFMRNGFSPVRRITDYAEVKGVMHDLVVFERRDDVQK